MKPISHPLCRRPQRGRATRAAASAAPRVLMALGGLLCVVACSDAPVPLPFPPPGSGGGAEPPPEPSETLNRQECVDFGGVVIGDPGDGSVHAPGFLCEDGEPPIATVVPLPGEPIAIEGEVCCGGAPPETLSRQECADLGGVVIGDPGDGSVHAPDFLCDDGEPPIATVVPLPGEPIASEGEVCCGEPSAAVE